MKKLFAIVLLVAGAVCAQPPPDPVFREIDQIVADLSGISGLKQLHRIEYDRIPRDQVKRFLEERVKETVKPEEIRSEEAVLKKFGFVPPEYDLRASTVELLTEQAAAFYDFKKKKLRVPRGVVDCQPHRPQRRRHRSVDAVSHGGGDRVA